MKEQVKKSLQYLFKTPLDFLPNLEESYIQLVQFHVNQKNNISRFLAARLRSSLDLYLEGKTSRLRVVNLTAKTKLVIDITSRHADWFYKQPNLAHIYHHEPQTTKFIQSHLDAGQVFIDVGCNVGYFSAIAAEIVGETGKVFAFEPNVRLHEQLRQSIQANGYENIIELDLVALSDEATNSAKLYVNNKYPGLSSISPWQGHLNSGILSETRTLSVPTMKFDDWVRDRNLDRIDIIKIDVEGFETRVVKGMEESFLKLKPRYIICETAKTSPVVSILGNYGYYPETTLESTAADGSRGNIIFSQKV